MLALAAVNRLGVDVAVAALLLNALGAALAAYVLFRALALSGLIRVAGPSVWVAGTVCAVVALPAAAAAYSGFGSMAYAGLTLFAVHACLESTPSTIAWVPVLSLTLALVRPDGAITGTAVALLGAFRAYRFRRVRAFGASAACASAFGLAYYVWRYRYFGLALPLPLYVKSRMGDTARFASWPASIRPVFAALPGLGANLRWVLVGGAAGSLVVFAVLAVRYRKRFATFSDSARMLAPGLPLAALWLALCVAYQTQNVAWRFQGPIQLGLLYLVLRGIGASLRQSMFTRQAALFAVAVALSSSALSGATQWFGLYRRSVAGDDYVSTFSVRYGRFLPNGARAAVGEAGRFPFWTTTNVLDAVGLNTPQTALRPVTRRVLAEFAPQIVFFSHGGVLDATPLRGGQVIVELRDPAALVRPHFAHFLATDLQSYSVPIPSTQLAPVVMTQYLQENRANYHVFAVDAFEDGSYAHVWAFRDDLDVQQALRCLRQSLTADSVHYLELAKERSWSARTAPALESGLLPVP